MLDLRWRARAQAWFRPLAQGLWRLRVKPDALTLAGMLLSGLSALAIAQGRFLWGALFLALSGAADVLDGTVAKVWNRADRRGAFLDSVSDRLSDALVLGGAAWHLSTRDSRLGVLVLAALAFSMLVPYERARAESLGLDARGGLMERAERMILLGAGLVFDLLVPALWALVGLSALTAVQRFLKVWQQAGPPFPLKVQPDPHGSRLLSDPKDSAS